MTAQERMRRPPDSILCVCRYERGTRGAGSYSRVFVWVVGRAGLSLLVLLHVLVRSPQRGHSPLLHGLKRM